MSVHVKDSVFLKSFAFRDAGIQECCFRFGDFIRKFDCRVMFICVFNKLRNFVSSQSQNSFLYLEVLACLCCNNDFDCIR